ncbi:hypothetical protein [Parapedobacter koreensis]|nr:hypothetical protein [Parapedobacter koreensis]
MWIAVYNDPVFLVISNSFIPKKNELLFNGGRIKQFNEPLPTSICPAYRHRKKFNPIYRKVASDKVMKILIIEDEINAAKELERILLDQDRPNEVLAILDTVETNAVSYILKPITEEAMARIITSSSGKNNKVPITAIAIK